MAKFFKIESGNPVTGHKFIFSHSLKTIKVIC